MRRQLLFRAMFGAVFFWNRQFYDDDIGHRNDWHDKRARLAARSTSANSAAAHRVLLSNGSARVCCVAEFRTKLKTGGFNEISSLDCYLGGIYRHCDGDVATGRLLQRQAKMLQQRLL